jgi:hypothetical protein
MNFERLGSNQVEDHYYTCNFRLGGPYATLGRDYANSLHDARARQLPGLYSLARHVWWECHILLAVQPSGTKLFMIVKPCAWMEMPHMNLEMICCNLIRYMWFLIIW